MTQIVIVGIYSVEKGGETMGAAERRKEIMKILCRRKFETTANLASEFGVSERTILRNIDILSLTEPIYTQCGRYGGGIYISKDYSMDKMYMTDGEIAVLRKLLGFSKNKESCNLSEDEHLTLERTIEQYTKSKSGEK